MSFDMDKMCNKLDLEKLEKTVVNSEEPEIFNRSESPVFKCVNTKTNRAPDSSDYDIPSYQLNQSVKSRASSKCENEMNDFILSFSPIFSPIPVDTVQFQPPSIHSLGTVIKNLEKERTSVKEAKQTSIFQSLGMNDKDISWVSSMASPPPKQLPSCEFNTIEKATFFPEEKFQKIQPRALFSPSSDNDFGCQPISSDNDSDDEAYKTNLRLSDVCATLKQLEFKPFESDVKEKSVDFISSPVIKMKKLESTRKKTKAILVKSPKDNYEFSVGATPISKAKEGSTSIEDDSFQSMSFSCLDELCKTVIEQSGTKPVIVQKKFYTTKTNDIYKASSVEMDELHSYARALEEGDTAILEGRKLDKSIADANIVRLDQLKYSKTDALKRSHSEVSDLKNESIEKKVKMVDVGWENSKEYLSESQLNVSDGEIYRTLENLEKTLASQEGRELKLSGKVSQEKIREEEYRHNPSDDICKNVNLKDKTSISRTFREALVTSSETEISLLENSLGEARHISRHCDKVHFLTIPKKLIKASDKALGQAKGLMVEFEKGTKETLVTEVSTRTGQVSTEASEKAMVLMEGSDKIQCFESGQIINPEKDKSNKPSCQGFLTASDMTTKVPPEALEKAKTLILGCESLEPDKLSHVKEFSTDCAKQSQISEDYDGSVRTQTIESRQPLGRSKEPKSESEIKIDTQNLIKLSFKGFSTGSGKQIQVSDEALKKSKALLQDFDETITSETELPKKLNSLNFQGFSTGSGKQIQVSDEALKKSRALLQDFDETITGETEVPKKLNSLSFHGFSTGSGKQIQVSDEALKKSRALLQDFDETVTSETELPKKLNSLSFQGFSTGSGKQIQVSDEALKKSKALMEDCYKKLPTIKESTNIVKNVTPDKKNKENALNFLGKSEKSYRLTEEALDTAKPTPEYQPSSELVLGNESFSKIKTSERGEKTEKISSMTDNKIKAGIGRLELKNETEDDEWNNIIPSWLHVYNTSPSIASDRLELTPIVSHESGNTSEPEKEYIKSPVLGLGDRFYQKIKKRKLDFTEEFVSSSSVKRAGKRTSKIPMDFSAPFKKAKFVEVQAVDVDVSTERQRARERQEKAIKEKEKVKPLKGLLLTKKCVGKRITWAEAVGSSSPEVYSEESLKTMGVRDEVLRVRIENAADFKFRGEHFFGSKCLNNVEGMPTGDGCLVILDDENAFGVEELKRAFLAAPGVQPDLLPFGWVENHYKWIVWKFAHYEKSFPRYFGGRCLTPNNVTLQLKYRYDREIDRNERSALKKILERDDTSAKRMVLCVCEIRKVLMGETSEYELSMTDGWYSCRVQVDAVMSRLIEEGKVFIGMKLMTQGATLVNCEQGVSPLEAGGNVHLKISTNSTRRVKWNTKLGFQKNPENFPVSLNSVLPQGGAISRLDVIIVRVYPVLYMEKTSDGQHVTRNRKSEEKVEAEYKRIQEQRMEKIWNEVQSEMRNALEKRKSEGIFNETEQEEGLSQLANGSSCPIDFKNTLMENNRYGQEFKDRVEKKLKNEKLIKRNVSPFLRAKIVDFRKPDYNNPAVLSVWNPNEDLMGLLSEGKALSLLNISISNSTRVYKALQINTNRQTQFRPVNRTIKYPARRLTRLNEVSCTVCPAFEEVDVVGMVAHIRDVSYGSRMSQVVYLTDFEFHFVGVVFWGSCRDYGWETVLKIRSIVACSNLQWKKAVTFNEIPTLHSSEYSVFTENPRHDYLKAEIARLKETMPKDLGDFLSKFQEELTIRLEESKWGANRSMNISKSHLSNGFETRPTASSTPIKAFPIRLTSGTYAEPSPIQKRIEKLQSYGEPPPLIPLFVRNRKVKKKS